ncbi:hypothetical protein EV666_10480 [Camelimonas lactis]|uniref:Uncharacterized protein n=1 Tax=Camelimonas lactis TaxID=659006 RepID=A0A4V2RXK0_9HYPH|nr:hypothetical protein EV666_10480 [Camelimonas lactis]
MAKGSVAKGSVAKGSVAKTNVAKTTAVKITAVKTNAVKTGVVGAENRSGFRRWRFCWRREPPPGAASGSGRRIVNQLSVTFDALASGGTRTLPEARRQRRAHGFYRAGSWRRRLSQRATRAITARMQWSDR